MPDVTPRLRLHRIPALLAAAALTLTACGDGDQKDSAEETPSVTPTPSTSVEVPEGTEITAPGTQLAFADRATVAHEVGEVGAVLDLTVESAQEGSIKDLSGFDLDDPYKRRGAYFYVRVTVGNAGEEPVGDIPVPLWGISGENTLLRAVDFKSSFNKCPTEPLPKKLAPGDRFKTCLVYLSPNHGTLEGVSYRPTEDFDSIEWRGKVKPLPEPKKGKGAKGKKKSE